MGYASTLPSGLSKVASGGYSATTLTLTSVALSQDCGTLTTPSYKGAPSVAFCDFIASARRDTSAANNYGNSVAAYIGLKTGAEATIDCGAFPDGCFWTDANTFEGSEWRVRGRTNIAASLRPNTTYTIRYMNSRSQGDSLILYNVVAELSLYFM